MQISNWLVEVMLNYLASKPYQEVVGLINSIIQETNNQPVEPVKDEDSENLPLEEAKS